MLTAWPVTATKDRQGGGCHQGQRACAAVAQNKTKGMTQCLSFFSLLHRGSDLGQRGHGRRGLLLGWKMSPHHGTLTPRGQNAVDQPYLNPLPREEIRQ